MASAASVHVFPGKRSVDEVKAAVLDALDTALRRRGLTRCDAALATTKVALARSGSALALFDPAGKPEELARRCSHVAPALLLLGGRGPAEVTLFHKGREQYDWARHLGPPAKKLAKAVQGLEADDAAQALASALAIDADTLLAHEPSRVEAMQWFGWHAPPKDSLPARLEPIDRDPQGLDTAVGPRGKPARITLRYANRGGACRGIKVRAAAAYGVGRLRAAEVSGVRLEPSADAWLGELPIPIASGGTLELEIAVAIQPASARVSFVVEPLGTPGGGYSDNFAVEVRSSREAAQPAAAAAPARPARAKGRSRAR